MFSNGSEAQRWQSRNCYHCWKYKPDMEKSDRALVRCKTAFDIDTGYIGILPEGKALAHMKKVIAGRDCPYRQEKRPVYKKHDGAMPLFEEVV